VPHGRAAAAPQPLDWRKGAPLSRSVLVTGGNRGIGLAIAAAFAEQGDKVALTYRSGEPPELKATGEGSVLPVRCDITSAEDVDRAFTEIEAAHGPVEILVANAGITRDTLVLRMSEQDFTDVLDTNLTGAFRVAKRATRGMLRLRRGRLIFISSVVGMSGSPGQVNYAASKAGLVGMARSLAHELGSRSITANVVAPGFVDTAMTAELTEERKKQILNAVPLGRYAQPEEIAGVVKFLASPEAAYITGAVVPVDGGLGMGH
jgi:3-oxoacyl-[acyl-carrier protein] reductase